MTDRVRVVTVTPKQGQLAGLIRDYAELGEYPTVRVLAKRLGIGSTGVANRMAYLRQKGVFLPKRSATLDRRLDPMVILRIDETRANRG